MSSDLILFQTAEGLRYMGQADYPFKPKVIEELCERCERLVRDIHSGQHEPVALSQRVLSGRMFPIHSNSSRAMFDWNLSYFLFLHHVEKSVNYREFLRKASPSWSYYLGEIGEETFLRLKANVVLLRTILLEGDVPKKDERPSYFRFLHHVEISATFKKFQKTHPKIQINKETFILIKTKLKDIRTILEKFPKKNENLFYYFPFLQHVEKSATFEKFQKNAMPSWIPFIQKIDEETFHSLKVALQDLRELLYKGTMPQSAVKVSNDEYDEKDSFVQANAIAATSLDDADVVVIPEEDGPPTAVVFDDSEFDQFQLQKIEPVRSLKQMAAWQHLKHFQDYTDNVGSRVFQDAMDFELIDIIDDFPREVSRASSQKLIELAEETQFQFTSNVVIAHTKWKILMSCPRLPKEALNSLLRGSAFHGHSQKVSHMIALRFEDITPESAGEALYQLVAGHKDYENAYKLQSFIPLIPQHLFLSILHRVITFYDGKDRRGLDLFTPYLDQVHVLESSMTGWDRHQVQKLFPRPDLIDQIIKVFMGTLLGTRDSLFS